MGKSKKIEGELISTQMTFLLTLTGLAKSRKYDTLFDLVFLISLYQNYMDIYGVISLIPRLN